MFSIPGIESLPIAAQLAVVFVIIFGVLALIVFVLHRLTGARGVAMQGADRERARTRQPRLGIVDVYDLDRQRQLVLLRRDNVEHLLLIGGPNDVVVETNIVRSSPGRLGVAPDNGERAETDRQTDAPSARPVLEAAWNGSGTNTPQLPAAETPAASPPARPARDKEHAPATGLQKTLSQYLRRPEAVPRADENPPSPPPEAADTPTPPRPSPRPSAPPILKPAAAPPATRPAAASPAPAPAEEATLPFGMRATPRPKPAAAAAPPPVAPPPPRPAPQSESPAAELPQDPVPTGSAVGEFVPTEPNLVDTALRRPLPPPPAQAAAFEPIESSGAAASAPVSTAAWTRPLPARPAHSS